MTSFTIDLPMPPSANNLNRASAKNGKTRFYSSNERKQFRRQADAAYLLQKRALQTVSGPFAYQITLNEDLRHGNADGDNRQKEALDYLQHVGLIEDDKLCEAGSWNWGACANGCRVRVWSVESSVNRVPASREVVGA